MPEPYIGEIRMFGGNFAPAGWAMCDGQQLPISENDALFTLIGTTYGGDGQETFNLPNLQSRVPMHVGNGLVLAEAAGTETVTLTTQQIPIHTHAMLCAGTIATSSAPQDNVLAGTQAATLTPYGSDNPPVNLSPNSVSPVGGSQPHENMQPYLCITFIISLYGIFPQQT
jgi:microcystin-dependent protein